MSTAQTKEPSAFQALLGDLDTMMTKSMPNEAAKPPAAGNEEDPEKKAAAEAAAAAAAKDGDPMTKSFQVTLANGEVIEAQDGTELVKSLLDRVDGQEDMMVKAMTGTLSLVKSLVARVTAQDELVKSLQADIARISNQGAGRKTLVNVHEQVNTMTKSLQQQAQGQGPTVEEFMAKSHAAFDAKKISGQELTSIDVSMRMGQPIDQALVAKVMK